MKMHMPLGRLLFDWKNIFSECAKLSQSEQAIFEEIIIQPYIQERIYEFRLKWKIPPATGLSGHSDLEANQDFEKDFEENIRLKCGFPEYLSKLIKSFVIYGDVRIPKQIEENASLRERMERALSAAEFYGEQGFFLYTLEGEERNPHALDFTHGGTTVGIDMDHYSVFIRQTVTSLPEEINELKPIIDGYKNALRKHQDQLRDRKKKQGERSFIIDCLVYRAVVEEGKTTNEDILASVQLHLEEYLPKGTDVHKLDEFKEDKKGKPSAFYKRVRRLRAEIEWESSDEY